MRIYISGPISGVEDYMDRFDKAEKYLKRAFRGAQIMNPARINSMLPEDFTHSEYMEMSLKELDMCDAICMIPGWRKSTGACIELGYAYAKDMNFIEPEEFNFYDSECEEQTPENSQMEVQEGEK